ncbi:MAG: CapA family protein [bacterium]|nr:CapA family protein [bacterium]
MKKKCSVTTISLVLLLSVMLCACGLSAESVPVDAANGEEETAVTQESEAEEPERHEKVTQNVYEEPPKEPAEPSTLNLIMVGDVLLHTPVTDSGELPDGTRNYDHLFIHVKDQIEQADIAIVNQEVILGGEELGLSGYPCFNGPYEVADALVDSGFDVILHATNHALDKGEQGIRSCLAYWQDQYPQIQVTGINESEEAQNNIVVIDQNDIRVAILNYTYGTNGIAMPSSAPYLVNLLDQDKIREDVAKAREQADFVVVCPHWGTEYRHTPDQNQEKWATFFADLGADLVIGTHPHVIEPVEWVEGADGNQTLVFYSLGNFVNATSGQGNGVADRMLGAMADVSLIKNEDGSVTINDYHAHPLVSHLKSGVQGITVYPLEEYTPKLKAENEIIRQDPKFSIEYLNKLWDEVM